LLSGLVVILVHPFRAPAQQDAPAYTVHMDAANRWKDAGSVEVLAFDIFGTVVDWHGSIVREMQALHPQVDAMPSLGPGARATGPPWRA
jgi:hypothetical protein